MPNPMLQSLQDFVVGHQYAQNLRQAALQQQELDQNNANTQARQRLSEQEFQAQQQSSLADRLASGAQPVSGGNVTTPSIQAGPAQQGTSAQQGTGADGLPAQSLAPMNPTLQTGAPTQLPADTSRPTYQTAGQTLQAPSLQDQLGRETQMQSAKEDALRTIPISDKLADAVGFQRGTKLAPEHVAGLGMLAHWLNPPNQDDSGPSVLNSHLSKDNHGNQTMVYGMSDGTVKELPIKARGTTNKFDQDNAADTGAEVQAKALSANGRMTASNQAMNEYHKFESEEQGHRQELDRLDHAIALGGQYDVKTVGGKAVMIDPKKSLGEDYDPTTGKAGLLEDLKQRRNLVNNSALQAMNNKKDAGQRYWDLNNIKGSWGNPGSASTGKPAAAAAPAAPTSVPTAQAAPAVQAQQPSAAVQAGTPSSYAQAQAPPPAKPAKTVTMEQLERYRQALKIPLSQAVQQFKQYHYKVVSGPAAGGGAAANQ